MQIPTAFSLFYAADPVAKVNIDSLSDEMRMELLVEHLTGKDLFQKQDGEYLESEWPGVTYSESGDVTAIEWTSETDIMHDDLVVEAGGSIDLRFLPSTVEDASISRLELDGTICTASLPRGLRILNLDENIFRNDFRIEHLPEKMERVCLYKNSFQGSLNIPMLPSGMYFFDVAFNFFEGTVDLTRLSANLKFLLLAGNYLTGDVDLRNIHEALSLNTISLTANKFAQGTLLIGDFPPKFGVVRFSQDAFETIAHPDGKAVKVENKESYSEIVQ